MSISPPPPPKKKKSAKHSLIHTLVLTITFFRSVWKFCLIYAWFMVFHIHPYHIDLYNVTIISILLLYVHLYLKVSQSWWKRSFLHSGRNGPLCEVRWLIWHFNLTFEFFFQVKTSISKLGRRKAMISRYHGRHAWYVHLACLAKVNFISMEKKYNSPI